MDLQILPNNYYHKSNMSGELLLWQHVQLVERLSFGVLVKDTCFTVNDFLASKTIPPESLNIYYPMNELLSQNIVETID